MQLMPKLWIAVAVNLVVFGIAVVTTHKYTKAAYHAVGFNDGTIDSNARILQRFTEIAGTIPKYSSRNKCEVLANRTGCDARRSVHRSASTASSGQHSSAAVMDAKMHIYFLAGT